MSFKQKRIEVSFKLRPTLDDAGNLTGVQPKFAGTEGNQVTLSGYRISAHIVKAGGASQGEAQVRIYGMPMQLMNQLSTLGRGPYPLMYSRSEMTIKAGEGEVLATVFQGTISQAYTDLGGPPEGLFVVSAYSLFYEALQKIAPTSFKGSADAATILSSMAAQMGLTFENNGVSVILSNRYYEGSAKSQAADVVRDANIEWNCGDDGVLAIWPKGGSRTGSIPLISPKTGLVGYPYPSSQNWIGLRTLFNPQIQFGGRVKVQSTITPACGVWTVYNVQHEIESEMPGGSWFTQIMATPPGYTIVSG